MKRILLFTILSLSFVLLSRSAKAQFFQNVLNSVKNTAQNRANTKAANATNKVIDKVDGTGKTATATTPNTPAAANNATLANPGTPATGGTTPAGAATPGGNATSGNSSAGSGGGSSGGEDSPNGYVRMKVSSSKTLVGTGITVTGFSVLYGNLKTVTLSSSGGSNTPPQTIPMKDSGSFSAVWMPPAQGVYKLTVKTADGKAQQSATVTVYPYMEMDSLTKSTEEETKKAYDKINDAVTKAVGLVSAKDGEILQQKWKAVSDKKDALLKVLGDINTAGKGLDDIQKKEGPLPASVTGNLSQLGGVLSDEAQQMQQANDAAPHTASDNTICEYLVMVSEALAAYSTFVTFGAKCSKILGGLVTGTVVPAGAGAVAGAVGGAVGGSAVGDNSSTIAKECSKLFVSAKTDNIFFSKMTSGDLVQDLTSICTDMLLKRYCAVMDGELHENYMLTFKNANNNVWWQYKYTTGATISLRYPKGGSTGGIIKMKGNIEGNATKFSIFTDMNEMDDFKKASKGRSKVISICVYAPPTVPFVSSQADKTTGFGAVARTIATPACFNIPIDADYNVDAHTVKIYLNEALVDFGPTVQYVYCYLDIALGIPLTTRVDLPINKVKLTLNKCITSGNNVFPVVVGSDNNLSITGKGNTTVAPGSSAEHKIDFSFTLKSD